MLTTTPTLAHPPCRYTSSHAIISVPKIFAIIESRPRAPSVFCASVCVRVCVCALYRVWICAHCYIIYLHNTFCWPRVASLIPFSVLWFLFVCALSVVRYSGLIKSLLSCVCGQSRAFEICETNKKKFIRSRLLYANTVCAVAHPQHAHNGMASRLSICVA